MFERGFTVLLSRMRYELAIADVAENLGALHSFSEVYAQWVEGADGEIDRVIDAARGRRRSRTLGRGEGSGLQR